MSEPVDECSLYADPALYDLMFPQARDSQAVRDEGRKQRILASERFYLGQAQSRGGRVLELGCGTGRLTIPIAQAGIEVLGVDLSETMLTAARFKAVTAAVNVTFAQADMRSFNLPGRFSSILIPGNSLLHLLTDLDWQRCLVCVREHLAPGGHLVFDISNPYALALDRDSDRRYPVMRVSDSERGEVNVEEASEYKAETKIRHVKWYFSAAGAPDFRIIEYSLRMMSPEELTRLLDEAGFRLEARYGEFSLEPFRPESPRQVCICSRK